MQRVDTLSTVMAAVFKQEAHKLIDQLPEAAGWDDLMYQAALRASVERGLAEAKTGQLIPIEDLFREYGLSG